MTSLSVISVIEQYVWSFPVLLFIFGVTVYLTCKLQFVQFRYFKESVAAIFESDNSFSKSARAESLSPFQAFMNTLGGNIGNGSLAGIAVAIHAGGPGALLWLLILSTFSVALRFAEVFLGTYVIGKHRYAGAQGGPMVYMSLLPAGSFWSCFYTTFALGFVFAAGSLAQSNSVGVAVQRSWNVDPFITSFFVLVFILYVMFGGARRIVRFLDMLVPFKVIAFVLAAVIVLIYNYKAIPFALWIICKSAIQPQAAVGGIVGLTLQHVISAGFQQGVFASEAGLGSAAIAFSSTKGKSPVENGILAMLGVFINIHVVCFLVGLCIIASGVWDNGETSSALLISSYETAFGSWGGWIVTFLVVNFAMSVLVAGAYNGKRCWDFFFAGKCSWLFIALYSGACFVGTWIDVSMVWSVNNIVNSLLLMTNLLGLLWFSGLIKKELDLYRDSHG